MKRFATAGRTLLATLALSAGACADSETNPYAQIPNHVTAPEAGAQPASGAPGGMTSTPAGGTPGGVAGGGAPGGAAGGGGANIAEAGLPGLDATSGQGGLGAGTDAAGSDAGAGSDAAGDATSGGLGERGPAPTLASATASGPYKVTSYTSGYRDGPSFADATVWYPSDATAPFALTVVVPGFVSAQSDIAPWGAFLASHGIVTMTIGTNSGFDDPPTRANALLDALKSLKDENAREGSALKGKLDVNSAALMGWSMGGGGTLIASSQTPALKAAITLCAWESKTFPNQKVPTLLIASMPDELAQGMSQPFYESIPATTPKMLFELKDGNHFIANDPKNKEGIIGRYGLSWLKVYLEGDLRYKQFLLQTPMPNNDFKTNLK